MDKNMEDKNGTYIWKQVTEYCILKPRQHKICPSVSYIIDIHYKGELAGRLTKDCSIEFNGFKIIEWDRYDEGFVVLKKTYNIKSRLKRKIVKLLNKTIKRLSKG